MMDLEAIHRLLLECGFRNMLWPPAVQRWGVVGELDGGGRIVVTCVPVRGGFMLQVPTESMREWLAEMLAQHDQRHVPIQVGPVHHPDLRSSGPWLALAVGAGAVALFTWVVSSIAAAAPFTR